MKFDLKRSYPSFYELLDKIPVGDYKEVVGVIVLALAMYKDRILSAKQIAQLLELASARFDFLAC